MFRDPIYYVHEQHTHHSQRQAAGMGSRQHGSRRLPGPDYQGEECPRVRLPECQGKLVPSHLARPDRRLRILGRMPGMTGGKNPVGRPRKADADKLTHVTVWMLPAERDAFKTKAKAEEVSLSAWIVKKLEGFRD